MKRRIVLNGILVSMLLLMLVVVDVHAKGMPRWNSKNNIIETDNMVVMFKDRMPIYHVWIPKDNGTAVYIVKFNRIIEYIDNNNNGVYDVGIDMILAVAPFTAHVNWDIKAEYINQSNNVELRITMNGTVPVLSEKRGTIGNVDVLIVNHIFSEDTNINGTPLEGGKELKIDIVLGDWPWSNDASMLALEIVYAGMFRGRTCIPSIQHHVREHNRHAVRMQANNTNFGVEFRYEDKAYIVRNNSKEEVKLNATNQFTRRAATTWISFPHYEGKFVYDPSIAIIENEGGALEFLNQPVAGIPFYLFVSIIAVVVLLAVVYKKFKR